MSSNGHKPGERFFVMIIVPKKLDLLSLRKYELDLFKPTAKEIEHGQFAIDGLLTLDQIGGLVKDGYKVVVKEESSKMGRARSEMGSFQQWMKGKESKLKGSRNSNSITGSVNGYLTSEGIESALLRLTKDYPLISKILVLDRPTHQGNICRAVKISNNVGDENRDGVLFIGGVHAREIVNPDLLISLAFDICHAYTTNSDLTFGGKYFSASKVQQILNQLSIYIFPLVNPDGRAYVQSRMGDPWWRKNMNPNPGLSCKGVDLNRNFDFLWDSGIGTSEDSCTEIFKGSKPFSEPETCNVLDMIDRSEDIRYMVDVHSYSELILFPWGDDESQTVDPVMNFRNPVFDGLRGNLGDSAYQEYILKTDLDWFVDVGNKMKRTIMSVRNNGRYKVQPSVGLYATSATSDDYAYSYQFLNTKKRKILAYTLETGTEFQPHYAEALKIIDEVSAGLVEFCLACVSIEKTKTKITHDLESNVIIGSRIRTKKKLTNRKV